jgi:hypothetical protein
MATYDPSVILTFADKLYEQAAGIEVAYEAAAPVPLARHEIEPAHFPGVFASLSPLAILRRRSAAIAIDSISTCFDVGVPPRPRTARSHPRSRPLST